MSSLVLFLLSVKKKRINWREFRGGPLQCLGAGAQDTQAEAEGAEFLRSEDEQAKGTQYLSSTL